MITDSNQQKVVVVNDDRVQRELLLGILKKGGFIGEGFPDAIQALKALSRMPNPPQLVVTDLRMPLMDGWQFCRLLRSPEHTRLNKVPILIVSATFAGQDARQLCHDAGADAFLAAPVALETFLETVRNLIAGKPQYTPARVMLIEQNQADAAALASGLRTHGYELVLCSDAASGLKRFSDTSPDIVILCHPLRDAKVEDVLGELERRVPKPISVIVTDATDPDLAVTWLQCGAAAHVRKPVRATYLAAVCSNLLRERSLLRTVDILEQRTRELREIQERFHLITENIHEIFWIADVNTKELLYLSPGFERIFGRKLSEVAPKPKRVLDFLHPEDRQLGEILYAGLERGEAVDAQLRVIRPDGATHWLAVRSFPIKQAEGMRRYLIGLAVDITAQKEAEAAAQHSYSLLAAALDSIADGILVVDCAGKVTTYNKRFLEMWRIPQEIVDTRDEDALLACVLEQLEQPDAFLTRVRALYADPEAVSFDRIRFKDGRVYDRYSQPHRLGDEIIGRVWSFLDVTNQVEAEERDQRRYLRLVRETQFLADLALTSDVSNGYLKKVMRRVTEGISETLGIERVGVWLFDKSTGNLVNQDTFLASKKRHVSGEVLDVSQYLPEFEALRKASYVAADDALSDPRLAGYVEGYIKPLHITSMLDVLIHIGDEQLGALCLEHVDIPHHWEDDEIAFANQLADQLALTIVNRDRLDFIQRLRVSEERQRAILEALPDLFFVLAADGTFLDAHAPDPTLFLVPPEKFLGKRVGEVLPEYLANLTMRYVHLTLSTKTLQTYDYQVTIKGQMRVFEARMAPFGESKVLVLVRDITSHRVMEAALRQAHKMQAVGQLAGGVAHDFNNYLQAVRGFTELALEKIEKGHTVYGYLEEVARATERARLLVSQLLAFSRRQLMNPEPLDLNLVISSLLKMLDRLLGEHIRIDFIQGRHLGTVYADHSMMEQIMLNLCLNARDAMPDGGILTIETENVFINGEYCATHPWAAPGRYVLISVTDTGCGMPPEILEKVFEPFFTTKPEGKGTGMGLATVYGIVKQHNGLIHGYSEVGKGTTFKIYIPICERPAAHIENKIEGLASGGTETILVAEDEDMVRTVAQKVLETAGYTVLTAQDGVEAVEMMKENPDRVDMLLLDVVMPRMGGKQAYEQIAAIKPDIPVLFTSGYTENAVHTNFVVKEGIELLQKPYGAQQLLQTVRRILDAAKDRMS